MALKLRVLVAQQSLSCSQGFALSHREQSTVIILSLGQLVANVQSMLGYKGPTSLPQDWTGTKIQFSFRTQQGNSLRPLLMPVQCLPLANTGSFTPAQMFILRALHKTILTHKLPSQGLFPGKPI